MEEHESKGVGVVVAGGGVTSSKISASAAPPLPPSSSKPSTAPAPEKRQMFSVELKPGETTIVSWKRLLKEDSKAHDSNLAEAVGGSESGPSVPPLEGELQDAQPSNRFNSVIEKIERLYMGKQSSDEEELDDMPDDDQYDTEDSFIDDAELDEYFQVDKLSTKHNGYFINRGKLERIEASSSPNLAPKKRRKDSTKANNETDRGHDTAAPAPAPVPPAAASVTTGNVRIKAAARNALLMGKKLASPCRIQTAHGNHYQEGKFSKNKLNAYAGTHKKRSADIATNLESTSSGRISKDVPALSLESNDLDRHKSGVLPSRDLAHKSRPISESVDTMHQASLDRAICSQVESLSRKSLNCEKEAEISTKIRRKERFGTDEFPNMDSPQGAYPTQVKHPSSTRVKDSSAVRPKGTSLERAIRDLEKIVALCRPQKFGFQEVDTSSQGVKRRLPQEVKQKLAKVARLSLTCQLTSSFSLSASQNKISEDLIDRLMGIVGHIVQRRTLKRNMREMIDVGVSTKQEKSVTFQQIKQAVNEMIKTRVSLLKSKVAEQHNGFADDFQEVNGNDERRAIRKYGMDIALEDKICDLYDLCVEGMDKDKRPQIRLLYEELAELWPNGYMDSNGITDAISRSKERKRSRMYRHKVRDVERIKRKQLASQARVEESSQGAQVQSSQERLATDSTAQVLAPQEKVTTNQPVASSSDSGCNHESKFYDKARTSSSTGMVIDNKTKTMVADVKKKRKPESDLGEMHAHPTKLPSLHGKEKHHSQKQNDDSNSFHQPKPNLQLPVAPTSSDQQK